ncbi:MAG: hypothetical protein FD153_428 [Rhodospirillaceae bacterium]|nr:MAG: hypothetical protein FD153_428 [Rhodospirillaceae bacterium]
MMNHTRAEITALRPEGADDKQIAIATNELDAVVEATEMATSEILEQAENIQTIFRIYGRPVLPITWTIWPATSMNWRTSGQPFCWRADSRVLPGQRINKIVNTLLYIEQHISTMMAIW